jgi:hypothetical protein
LTGKDIIILTSVRAAMRTSSIAAPILRSAPSGSRCSSASSGMGKFAPRRFNRSRLFARSPVYLDIAALSSSADRPRQYKGRSDGCGRLIAQFWSLRMEGLRHDKGDASCRDFHLSEAWHQSNGDQDNRQNCKNDGGVSRLEIISIQEPNLAVFGQSRLGPGKTRPQGR